MHFLMKTYHFTVNLYRKNVEPIPVYNLIFVKQI